MAAPLTIEAVLVWMADGDRFNKFDSSFAHGLAEKVRQGLPLSGKSRRAAWRMLRKYADVLAEAGTDYAALQPAESDDAPAPAPVQRQAAAADRANQVHITVENDRIFVRSPFRYKDVSKSIPGARWNKDAKAWTYAASATAAMHVQDAFSGAPVVTNAGYDRLVEEGAQRRRNESIKDTDADLPPIPVTSDTPPWPHQVRGFWWAKDLPAVCLDMYMGTGKSRLVIDLLNNNGARAALIMCPKNVVRVWPKQFRIWSPVEWHVIGELHPEKGKAGSVKERVAAFDHALHECRCGRPHALIANYEMTAHEPFKSWGQSQRYDYLVCDEGHRIKGGGVWAKWCQAAGKRAARRIDPTGTPFPQTPLDIFHQYKMLDRDIFGPSFVAFRKRFAVMGGYQDYEVVGYKDQAELNRKFRQIAFTVGQEVLDVLDPRFVTRYCTLGGEAARVSKDLHGGFYSTLDEESRTSVTNVLTKILRLQQVTGGHLPDDEGNMHEIGTEKRDLLEDVLKDEIPADEPVVVVCRFIEDLNNVRHVAEKLGRRYGELSGRRKDGLTSDATMSPDVDVLGVQIQAGGVGIDLTRAAFCVLYSIGWSLGDYQQFLSRIVRPGQGRSALFISLAAENTIDEQITDSLRSNEEVIEYIKNLHKQPAEEVA